MPSTTNPEPLEVVTDASNFASNCDFVSRLRSLIQETRSFREFVYTGVTKSWAEEAVKVLNGTLERPARKNYNPVTKVFWVRVMPQKIHDVHQRWWHIQYTEWLRLGLLTWDEGQYLWPGVGATIEFFHGPYASSVKEPDYYVRVDSQPMPRLVMETGWSESFNRLQDDMNLWLAGGNGDVGACLLLKWQRIGQSDRVRGWVELYCLNAQGMSVLKQCEVVFPVPHCETVPPVIHVPRRLFFDVTRLNSRDMLPFDIDLLRNLASVALESMSLAPASE